MRRGKRKVMLRHATPAGLLAIGVLMTVLTGPAAGPDPVSSATATTAAWRLNGYSAGNNAFNPDETVVTPTTVNRLTNVWAVVSLTRPGCSQRSLPVVADGKVYSSDASGVFAHDERTGAVVWRQTLPETGDTVLTGLAAVDGRLFVGSVTTCGSESDTDGALSVLDAATGSLLWRQFFDTPVETIVVDRDTVAISGSEWGAITRAFAVADGTLRWERPDALLRYPVSGSGRLLLRMIEAGGSMAVDMATNAVMWSSSRDYTVLAAGVTGGRFLAKRPDSALVAINSATGAVQWSVGNAAGEVAVDASRVYVAGPGNTLTVRNIITGAPVWSHTFTSAPGRPVVAGGVVYVVAGGVLNTLQASDGQALENWVNSGPLTGHPVIVNGRVLVTSGRILDAYEP